MTEREKHFWGAACDAEAEADLLACQLSQLTWRTSLTDVEDVRRQANVALAAFRRLQEYLGRLQEHLP